MSPTVLRKAGYRFFFFSREETRIHVHVHTANGEAKFWLEPEIELARNHRLTQFSCKTFALSSRSTMTASLQHGGSISQGVEVSHISAHGFWLLAGDARSYSCRSRISHGSGTRRLGKCSMCKSRLLDIFTGPIWTLTSRRRSSPTPENIRCSPSDSGNMPAAENIDRLICRLAISCLNLDWRAEPLRHPFAEPEQAASPSSGMSQSRSQASIGG